MPKALEGKLKREVAGKNWSQERKDAYVYGTMRKTGWVPSKGVKEHSPVKMIKRENGRLE
jgi:hypothetical protein